MEAAPAHEPEPEPEPPAQPIAEGHPPERKPPRLFDTSSAAFMDAAEQTDLLTAVSRSPGGSVPPHVAESLRAAVLQCTAYPKFNAEMTERLAALTVRVEDGSFEGCEGVSLKLAELLALQLQDQSWGEEALKVKQITLMTMRAMLQRGTRSFGWVLMAAATESTQVLANLAHQTKGLSQPEAAAIHAVAKVSPPPRLPTIFLAGLRPHPAAPACPAAGGGAVPVGLGAARHRPDPKRHGQRQPLVHRLRHRRRRWQDVRQAGGRARLLRRQPQPVSARPLADDFPRRAARSHTHPVAGRSRRSRSRSARRARTRCGGAVRPTIIAGIWVAFFQECQQ